MITPGEGRLYLRPGVLMEAPWLEETRHSEPKLQVDGEQPGWVLGTGA